jgi:DNA-binding transcriptional LysR family regulator
MVAAMVKDLSWTDSKVIDITELNNKPLIFYRRFERLIFNACQDSNFQPTVFCKNDDARTSLLWANAGLGIAIVPKSSIKLIGSSNLIFNEINNADLSTQISIIWSKTGYLSSAGKNFLELFKNV